MMRFPWRRQLAAIFAVALLTAAAAAALPDRPYQRWQLIEDTLYANATWSFERITFDPNRIDVAILGASRSQLGLSAPRIAAQLVVAGLPLTVANLSVIEDGRNLQWAIADELFRVKPPKVLVIGISEQPNRWGHPGFKYVAPTEAIVAPPVPFLHNWLGDLAYLPYRQMMLFGASFVPAWFGLHADFDPVRYAAKPADYSQSRVLADGVRIDMDRTNSAAALRAEARAFAASRGTSRLPAAVATLTDRDNAVYLAAIARLAARHGTRIIFVFLPEFDGATAIDGRAAYARLGRIVDDGDLAHDPRWFQSFAHLNERGADVASDRLAAAIIEEVGPGARRAAGAGGNGVARSSDGGPSAMTNN